MKGKNITLIVVVLIVALLIYYIESSKVSPRNFDRENIVDIYDTIITNNKTSGSEAEIESIEVNNEEIIKEVNEDETSQNIINKEKLYLKAPELKGISGYLNSENEFKISDFRGKIVLVDFWTYSCINCIRTLPHLTEWDRKYRNKGLVIIGVHTPEFNFEKDYNNVKSAIEKYNIEYRVAQDNDYATWTAYKNRFWPRKYLIDAEGFIRFDHIGEGAYSETEMKIQELLSEIDSDISDMGLSSIEDTTPKIITSPELYAGYSFALSRGQNLGNDEGFKVDETYNYKFPTELKKDLIYLDGFWYSSEDNLESKGNGSVVLKFTGKSVNIVADSMNGTFDVFIDGNYISEKNYGQDIKFDRERSYIYVDEPRLYNLFNGEYGTYTLKIETDGSFSFNAFTFG